MSDNTTKKLFNTGLYKRYIVYSKTIG